MSSESQPLVRFLVGVTNAKPSGFVPDILPAACSLDLSLLNPQPGLLHSVVYPLGNNKNSFQGQTAQHTRHARGRGKPYGWWWEFYQTNFVADRAVGF